MQDDTHGILMSNVETIPGRSIVEQYGLVSGSTVRAKNFGKDLIANLRNVIGGELPEYTELLRDARQQAVDRMCEAAAQRGANAVVNVRFATSSIASGAAELYVYGTAVKVD